MIANAAKTKLQILKESTVYVFLLGFITWLVFEIVSLIISQEKFLENIISSTIVCGLIGFLITSFIMGYLFEKDKPLWMGFLKFVLIGICSTIITTIFTLILLPFVFDSMMDQTSSLWKGIWDRGIIVGLILMIPMFILGIVFAMLGVFAFLLLSYFLGSWIFSFLIQAFWEKYLSAQSTNETDKTSFS